MSSDWYDEEVKQGRFIDENGIVHWDKDAPSGLEGQPIYNPNNLTQDMGHAAIIRAGQEIIQF